MYHLLKLRAIGACGLAYFLNHGCSTGGKIGMTILFGAQEKLVVKEINRLKIPNSLEKEVIKHENPAIQD